jgi:hypothetical protein
MNTKIMSIDCKVPSATDTLTEMVDEIVRAEKSQRAKRAGVRAGCLAYIIWRHTREQGFAASELYPHYWGNILGRTTGLRLSPRQVQRALRFLRERQLVEMVMKRSWVGGWQKPQYRASGDLMELGNALLRSSRKAA